MTSKLEKPLMEVLWADSVGRMREVVAQHQDLLGDEAIVLIAHLCEDVPERLRPRVRVVRDALMEWRAAGLDAPVEGPPVKTTDAADVLASLAEASATAAGLRTVVERAPPLLIDEVEARLLELEADSSADTADMMRAIVEFLRGYRRGDVDAACAAYDRDVDEMKAASELAAQLAVMTDGAEITAFIGEHPILLGHQAERALHAIAGTLEDKPGLRAKLQLDRKLDLLAWVREARDRPTQSESVTEAQATLARVRSEVVRLQGIDDRSTREQATAASIADCDAVLQKLGDAREFPEALLVVETMLLKASLLELIERSEEAIAAYDALVRRYQDVELQGVAGTVATAMMNKADALGRLGRSDEAVVAYDDVVARCAEADDPVMAAMAAEGLFSRAYESAKMGRSDEEIATYDELVARFGSADDPAVLEQVARALVNKAIMLGEQGQFDQEIAIYDDVVARFGDQPVPALRETAARALTAKADRLGTLGRVDEQASTLETLASLLAAPPQT
jgi:tetratricopeptide (TPR) repeat protein